MGREQRNPKGLTTGAPVDQRVVHVHHVDATMGRVRPPGCRQQLVRVAADGVPAQVKNDLPVAQATCWRRNGAVSRRSQSSS